MQENENYNSKLISNQMELVLNYVKIMLRLKLEICNL